MTTKTRPPRFDYRDACAKLAEPATRALPDSVLSIYRELRDAPEYENLAQGHSLDVPIPEALRPRLEALDSATLALAARVLYFFGHWGGASTRLDADRPDKRGATWKFANLADQVLRTRLGVPNRGSANMIGYHFEIHEGALRLCASSPDFWLWCEIGPATEEFLALARRWRESLTGAPASRYSRTDARWAEFETAAHAATSEVPAVLEAALSEQWRGFIHAGRDFMKPTGQCVDDCAECGHQRLFGNAVLDHETSCSRWPAAQVAAKSAIASLTRAQEKFDAHGIDTAPIRTAIAALEPLAREVPA